MDDNDDDNQQQQQFAVTCPPGVSPGMQIQVNLPMAPPQIAATVTASDTNIDNNNQDDVSEMTGPTATITQQLSFQAPPAYAPNSNNNDNNDNTSSLAPTDAILVTQDNRSEIMNHVKATTAPGSMTMMMGEMPPGMSESDLFRSGVSAMPPPKDPSWKELSPEDVAEEYLHQQQGMERFTITAPPGALGLTIGQKGPHLGHLIAVVKPNSPLKLSVKPMDELVALNEQDLTQYSTNQTTQALLQSAKTSRKLTFLRKMKEGGTTSTTNNTATKTPVPPQTQQMQRPAAPPRALLVVVPQGVAPGQSFQVDTGTQKMSVVCPPGVQPGMQLQIMPPAAVSNNPPSTGNPTTTMAPTNNNDRCCC